jgi:hypothetical protein
MLGLDEGLDGMADIAGRAAGPDRGDTTHHAFISDLDQPLGAPWNFSDGKHAARIAVPLIENEGDVDIDDIALAQRLVRRNSVANHVIDGRAGRLAVAAIHQRRRQGAMIHAEFEHFPIDVLGRNARPDLVDQHVQAFGRKLSGLAHAFKGIGAVNLDLPGFAQWRTGRIDVGHGVPECLRSLARNVSIGVRSASNLKGKRQWTILPANSSSI